MQIKELRSHCYRHSLAMRYLERGSKYHNISMVLGDEVATIEKYYSELRPNSAQREAFERAFAGTNVQDSTGTIQPDWLKRGSDRNLSSTLSQLNSEYRPSEMVDAGGFEPPATWLQTRCSSKLS